MHKKRGWGFTITELMIVIVVLAILAAITAVSYQDARKRTVRTVLAATLRQASDTTTLHNLQSKTAPESLPSDIKPPDNISLELKSATSSESLEHYTGLSPVQNGVLFHSVCEELITDPQHSTIHPKDGGTPQSVVLSCNDSIAANRLLISAWDSIGWNTPVTKATLQSYIDSVPYDNWWTDRQDVVRGFYETLISRFEAKGGSFPITSFWDPWANQWSGVKKEELPTPTPPSVSNDLSFCIQANYLTDPSATMHILSGGLPEDGECP